jgi:hypothetical protein
MKLVAPFSWRSRSGAADRAGLRLDLSVTCAAAGATAYKSASCRLAYSLLYALAPEISKPVGGHVGVFNRVLDVLVPEVVLQRSGVVTIVGELEAAGMAQHVRMHGKGRLGGLAEPCSEMKT